MSEKKAEAQGALDRLADALVDDILCASDEEILAEFKEDGGDAAGHRAEMVAHFERSVIAANKNKLRAAKAGAAEARSAGPGSDLPIDISEARATLKQLMSRPEVMADLTMAARKESELSDADVFGVLEDLQALGIAISDDNEDGSN